MDTLDLSVEETSNYKANYPYAQFYLESRGALQFFLKKNYENRLFTCYTSQIKNEKYSAIKIQETNDNGPYDRKCFVLDVLAYSHYDLKMIYTLLMNRGSDKETVKIRILKLYEEDMDKMEWDNEMKIKYLYIHLLLFECNPHREGYFFEWHNLYTTVDDMRTMRLDTIQNTLLSEYNKMFLDKIKSL